MRNHAHEIRRLNPLLIFVFFVLAAWSEVAMAAVVVEELPASSALVPAGMAVGDRLHSWQRTDRDSGSLDSPFDWHWLKVEQAPRGPVRLKGERRGEPLEVTVEPGAWEGRVRPDMPLTLLEAFRSGADRLAAGDAAAAAQLWQRAAATASPALRCWLLLRAGEVLSEDGQAEAADSLLREALELAATPRARVAVLNRLGNVLLLRNELEASEQTWRTARDVWRSEWPGSLGEAATWSDLARVAETRGDLDAVNDLLAQTATRLDALAPQSVPRARLWASQGRNAYSRGLYDEAAAAHRQAADLLARLAPETVHMAVGWMNLGMIPFERGDFDAAEDYHHRAWALFERLQPRSLNAAACLNNLGALAYQRSDWAAAEEYFLRALEVRESLSPDSVAVAANLSNLGVIARLRGDPERAEAYYRRALTIEQKLAPDSVGAASTLINLGNVVRQYGDLTQAESLGLQALAIQQKLSPMGAGTALTLINLGSLTLQRGDLSGAESWYRRALRIQEQTAPKGQKMATLQAAIGNLLIVRGEWDKAEEHLMRALELSQERAEKSLEVSSILTSLADLAQRRGQLDLAAQHQLRALAIQREQAPETLLLTRSLINLGNLAYQRGELATARGHLRHTLELLEPRVPESQVTAEALRSLGEVELADGQLQAAVGYLTRALALFDRQHLQSYRQVECLELLARVARQQAQPRLAWQHLERAIEVLEAQIGTLGGARELHGSFRARYGYVYRAAIEVLLELGRPADAFEILEHRRGRGLLAMLAERDLVFRDVPQDLEQARRRLAARHDLALHQLSQPETSFEEVATLQQTVAQLHEQRRDLRARIREASPKLAELDDPRPASLATIQDALDSGTLLLSYSVGEHGSLLFAIGRETPLQVFELDGGEAELRRTVTGFRTLIEERRHPSSRAFRALTAAATHLYDRLLRPAGDLVAASDHILVVPDGPLFQLPFAALIEAAPDGGWHYLIETKPVHTVISGTLYARLRPSRAPSPREPGPQLVAFGDPVYPAPPTLQARPEAAGGGPGDIAWQEPQLRSASRFFDLHPLPGSRNEAERIAGLYTTQAELLLGDAATEERAKTLDRRTRYVHFAAHGLLDERFPLDSAVALSLRDPPEAGRDNGLLQVWEIFEQVRVDADLVVLSACQTAAGEYVDGEGLIGLTRAFHYAGARSVAASLWSVDDLATAELMVHFHRSLRQGMSKDEALRSAQLGLLRGTSPRGPDAAAPYFWAAFQLYGDRR